jgi:hypothetical protein
LTEVFVKDTDKTKEQLMKELTEVQRQLAQLKASETGYKQAQLVVLENQALLAGVLDIASEAIISTDETQQIRMKPSKLSCLTKEPKKSLAIHLTKRLGNHLTSSCQRDL